MINEFKLEHTGKTSTCLCLTIWSVEKIMGTILYAENDHVEIELVSEDMGKPISVAIIN